MNKATLAKQLKLIITGMTLCAVMIYAWAFPMIGSEIIRKYPELSSWYNPWLVFLWLTGVPCFLAFYFLYRFAKSVEQDKIFTTTNALRFQTISKLAAGDAVFFLSGNILLFLMQMNHPSIVLCALGIVFLGAAITVLFRALSYMIQKAACLQEQSDLTI